ncbi:MAG: prevent-host-death protein [Epsilonproteobacteria bacterium]|nr:prevent-host-death protein [Campylobacterota bacterium]NPA64314.1 prevent-host-death protein [Campylobacterota bacterium]
MVINANEVKRRGVSIFEELLQKFDEVIVSVRGKKRYVVVDIERYEELRAAELEKAYREVLEDIEAGRYRVVSAKEHIESLKRDLDVSDR